MNLDMGLRKASMAKGNILSSNGDGSFLVRLYYDPDDRTNRISAIQAEITVLESDRGDLNTDYGTITSQLNQKKSEYVSKTGQLLECLNSYGEQNCSDLEKDSVALYKEVLELATQRDAIKGEIRRLDGRISEAKKEELIWTNDVKEYEDVTLWSLDLIDPGSTKEPPANDVDVRIIPVMGVRQSDYFNMFVPEVYHVITRLDTNDVETYDANIHGRTQQMFARRDKPYGAMSVIQNTTLATRWDEDKITFRVGVVTDVFSNTIFVKFFGTTPETPESDGSYGGGIGPTQCTVEYCASDILRTYAVGDKVIVEFTGGTPIVKGFAEYPKSCCKWPQATLALDSVVLTWWPHREYHDTDLGPDYCFVAFGTADAVNHKLVQQITVTPEWEGIEYEVVSGGGQIDIDIGVLEEMDGGIFRHYFAGPNFFYHHSYIFEYLYCAYSGYNGYRWNEQADDYTWTEQADVINNLKNLIKPVEVRRKDTGEIRRYDTVLIDPDGDLDSYMLISDHTCIPNGAQTWQRIKLGN